MYSDYVRYVEQLRRYHAVFGPEQVLVLVYDDFRDDNEATLRRVLRFLDVEEDHPIETTEANPTVRVRSQRMHELVHALWRHIETQELDRDQPRTIGIVRTKHRTERSGTDLMKDPERSERIRGRGTGSFCMQRDNSSGKADRS